MEDTSTQSSQTTDPDEQTGAPPDGPDRPIFIVACPRSGTTLLQLMLSAHPRISIPPENRFLLDAYRARRTFGNLREKEKREGLADWIIARRKWNDFKLDAEKVKSAIVDGPPTIGSALGIVLREYATKNGKPRWGDKRPVYLNHLPWLLEMFPDIQIVHIIRDGRDCVASLKRMPWWTTGSIAAISRWIQAMHMGRRARASIPPDQYYELQYEHLVANPREELEKLCAFLGEEFSEVMLEHHRAVPDATPEYKKWHSRTSEAVSTKSINQWAEQLEPWEQAVMETLGRRYLTQYGYPLSENRPKAPPGKLLQAAIDVRRREWRVVRMRYRDRQRAKKYSLPVAAQLTSGQIRRAEELGERPKPKKAEAKKAKSEGAAEAGRVPDRAAGW